MEFIRARDLGEQCQRAIGYTSAVPAGNLFADRLADHINAALRKVWHHSQWPQLVRIERRTFRPPWRGGVAYLRGHEVWSARAYWRALKDGPTHSPGYDPEEWRKLAPEEVLRFIAYDQPWENSEIDPSGINTQLFAFAEDIRRVPNAEPITPVIPVGDWPGGGSNRLQLPPDAPDEVWIRFIPKCVRISFRPYEPGETYAYGEVCLNGRDAWRCIERGGIRGVEPSPDTLQWEALRIPEFLVPAIVGMVRAGYAADDAGRAREMALAEQELDSLHSDYFGMTGICDIAEVGRE